MFNCGRTQIAQILKNKDSVISLYQSNQSKNKKKCLEFKCLKILIKLYINGIWHLVLRIEKVKQIADVLGKPEFKGSNGWLTKWKNRYNIKKVRICGEFGDVRG